jgi:hypothetical protein
MFAGKARAYPSVEHRNGFACKLIRLGSEGLQGTNTLAYCAHMYIMRVESSMTLTPVVDFINMLRT